MPETNGYESTFPAATPQPATGQYLLSGVLALACIQVGEIIPVEILVLVGTGIG
jgi:hypothetical protein